MTNRSAEILDNLITRYPQLRECQASIKNAANMLIETYQVNGKLLTCGNGGSAADANHIVGELMKSFVQPRSIGTDFYKLLHTIAPNEASEIDGKLQGTLSAIALTEQSSIISAFANDVSPQLVYAQQVLGYGNAGDTLLGISTSGNSKNVVYAIIVAKAKGMHTIAMTGKNSSRLSNLCDITICVPETDTFKVQELHLPIYHCLCMILEHEFF